MQTSAPTLMDIIEPPGNPWLQKVLKGKSGAAPDGVRVVRFSVEDEDEPSNQAKREERAA